MASGFLHIASTESVRRAQERYYGSSRRIVGAPERDPLTEEAMSFVRSRDSFYLATVGETGWPYLQHRGGRRGFLRVTSPTQLAFADYAGNRQMLSTGNLAANDRVALFLMDYPRQTRLKILGHARVVDANENPEELARIADAGASPKVERLFFIEVVSFDWNCPKHITPRYTLEEIEDLVAPLKQRILDLEARLKREAV